MLAAPAQSGGRKLHVKKHSKAFPVQLCYVDEAGDETPYSSDHADQLPVFALVGMSIPLGRQDDLIWRFLDLKKRFFPSLQRVRLHELLTFECKGSTLRGELRATGRKARRRATTILGEVMGLLETHGVTLFGEVLIKEEGQSNAPHKLYPDAVASIAESFDSLLTAGHLTGLMVLDSRTKAKNAGNVNAITTR